MHLFLKRKQQKNGSVGVFWESPDFFGHFLQRAAGQDSKVRQVQHGHPQTLVLKLVQLGISVEILHGHHVMDEIMLSLKKEKHKSTIDKISKSITITITYLNI